ncbi:MAG TPA: hypothetical protein VJU79_08240 [Candidatus Dormibacteraeota bacterium]|nr:hypothetical protein [Candidatus Dormibacteraeota bacterium]
MIAVARAALREGVERLPAAQPAGVELDIRLLVDHRERLVGMRTAIYNDLLWHLHDLWPEQTFPAARCCPRSRPPAFHGAWHAPSKQRGSGSRATSWATCASCLTPSTCSRPRSPISSPRSRRSCWQTRVRAADRRQADRRDRRRPALLKRRQARPRGRHRPHPGQHGQHQPHRLDRGGNRQLNTAIHRVAVTRARCHPETKAYLERKRAEGKTNREAIRCLKRHLVRRVWHLLQPPTAAAPEGLKISIS